MKVITQFVEIPLEKHVHVPLQTQYIDRQDDNSVTFNKSEKRIQGLL